MSKQNIGTFVKAGVLGVIFCHPRWHWHRQHGAGGTAFVGRSVTLMKQHDIATELDRAFAAATRHALMNGVEISDMVDPLYAIHKALNTKHASGELTDEQYAEKARELLWMVGWLRNALFHKTMA